METPGRKMNLLTEPIHWTIEEKLAVNIFVYGVIYMACFFIAKEKGSKYGIQVKCIGIVGSWALNIYRDGLY